MVWMSSLSTAVAGVCPAAGGFRLTPLSPSLSVLLDRVSTSWGDRGVKEGEELEERKAASSSCFYRDLAKWATAIARRRSDVGEQGRKSRPKKQEETSQSF